MEENTNIFERIMEVAVIKGIKNVPDLAIFLNYDSPEKLYRLKRKPDAKPSFDIIEDLTNKFEDLNLRWLVTGSGEMLLDAKKYVDTPTVQSMVNDANEGYITNTPTPSTVTKTKKAAKHDPPTDPPTRFLAPKIVTVDSQQRDNIVHVSIKAAAGYLKGYADPEYIENLPSFSLPGLAGGTFRSFEVDGDSMYPTLKNKQMIIGRWVESLGDIRDDRVYIVVHKTLGVTTKRLIKRGERIFAKSDATNDRELYKTFEIFPEDIKEVWYAVFNGGFDFQSPGDLWKRLNNTEADLAIVMNILKQANLLPDGR